VTKDVEKLWESLGRLKAQLKEVKMSTPRESATKGKSEANLVERVKRLETQLPRDVDDLARRVQL